MEIRIPCQLSKPFSEHKNVELQIKDNHGAVAEVYTLSLRVLGVGEDSVIMTVPADELFEAISLYRSRYHG